MSRSKLFVLKLLMLLSSFAHAQVLNANKGITFQGVIKDISNPANPTFPTVTSNVAVQILGIRSDGHSCILWEELHSAVSIEKGYLYLIVGRGNKTATSSLSFQDVFSDKPKAGLSCSSGTTYTPLTTDARKLRVVVSSLSITADFNFRSAPFAVQAENANNSEKLAGKSAAEFLTVNAGAGLTQTSAEAWFSQTVLMNSLMNGTYNAATATSISGVVALANGGTGATTAAGVRSNLELGTLATLSPTGTANGSSFLRGDGTWASLPSAPNLAGDVSGAPGANTVDKIKGVVVNVTAPADGEFFRFSGGAWINGALVAADVPTLDWNKITTGKPTTLAGYGISDAVNKNGDTMAGPLNMAGNNISSSGYILMSPQRALGLGTYTNAHETTLVGSLDATHKGYTWYNSDSNQVKFWNGAAVQTLGVAGSGITSIGGQTGGVQGFATGIAGTAPVWSSGSDTHTLNIPMAATATVTAGLLSNTDYAAFAAKLGTATTFGGDVTGTYNAITLNTVPIGKGGTGQTTAAAAFDALSPLASKGDVLVHNGTTNQRMAVGANGKALIADSNETSGVKWGDIFATDLLSMVTTGIVQRNSAGSYSAVTVNGPVTYSSGALGLNVGTVAGSVAAGDDSRITGALQRSGGTMAGAINMGGQDLTATGYVLISPQRALGLGTYTNAQEATLVGSLNATHKGYAWFNSDANQVKIWNGTAAQALGIAGSGITSFGGQSGNAQSLAIGTTGNSPTWNSASDTHTLNIPMASAAGVTAGLLNKTDYDAFAAKQPAGNYVTAAAGSIVQADMDFSGVNTATTSFTMVDAGGKFYEFACATTGHVPTWTAAGFVCQAPTPSLPILSSANIWVGNGSNAATAVTMSGDATMVNTGAVTLANSGVIAGTYSKVTVDTKGRVTAGANIAAGDVTTALGYTPVNAAGDTVTGDLTFTGTKGIHFHDTTGSEKVYLKSPSALAASYNLTWPATVPAAGQSLQTDALGNLSWYTPSTGSGDFKADGTVDMTGTLKAIPGTAALPGYSFAGDANTGLFTATADTFGIATAGAERVRIDATGLVGIGTVTPSFSLSIGDGVSKDGSFVAKGYGTVGTDGLGLTESGAGTRMIWYTKKAAFRAGSVSGAEWDDANIGKYSVAFGADTIASGDHTAAFGDGAAASDSGAFAVGWHAVASGVSSLAVGEGATSSGLASVALGTGTKAIGLRAVAIGESTTANANRSAAMGFKTTADSFIQMTVGQYNLPVGTENPASWVATDPLFVVGNGTGSGASRKNAMMILKNGNVGIGTAAPGSSLEVKGEIRTAGTTSGYSGFKAPASGNNITYTLPGSDGTSNQVLTTNGSGTLSWTSPAAGGITALTGEVTAAGSGAVAATIAADAVTSAKIANGTIVGADMDFTGVNTATTSFSMKDSAGKFYNFACATTGQVPTWTAAGFVCQAAASGDFKADGSVNMTGTLKAVAGTAAAPGYALVGDTNTGMFGAAADTLGFSTAGVERMRLDGSGMMVSGAGTYLTIKDTVSGGDSEIGLFLEGDGATGGLAAFSDGYTNPPEWADSLMLYSDTANSGGLRLHANGGNITFGNGWSPKVDRMVILPSGNIGIGTPAPGSALDVKGEVRMTGSTSGYSGFRAPASGSNITYTLPGTAGSNNQVLTTNGSGTLSWTTPAAGGITSLGGLTAATQTFAIGTSGNSPAFSSVTSTHTLNIPMASATSVTAGLISKSEYDTFNGKLSAAITSPLAGQHIRFNGSNWVNAQVGLSSDVTGTLPIGNGGTGATTAGTARTSLGIGTAGIRDTGAVSGSVPLVGVSGIVANKMCTSDGTSSIICNTNIPASQWISSASDIYFNTGKVAIGSAGADRNLTVTNSSTGQGAVSIQNNNSSGMSIIEFFNQGGSTEGFVGWANSGASGVSNAVVLGSLGSRDVTLFTNNTKVLSAYSSGNVGIGASGDPGVKLKVNGTIASAQVNDLSPTSFDLSLGNSQHTSTGCSGTSWDLVNMVEGATYTITVQNDTHTGACSFTNSGSSFRYQPSNATPGVGHVIYSLMKVGTVVYVSWIEGFN